ncbi:YdiY family protein [Porphyrobacter sp. GA68]|uniref:DUF481 domain-containing protein n=1 Tax=Porphyrobacter sp. GA68 TaxID=2883480 RepID=UPI001D19828C|nr:DUF481 domain-containing protein [Porphyrobacter sp. GA68]
MPRLSLPIAALCFPAPAAAQLAEPVRAMVEAAIANGDPAQIEAVVAIARQTQPEGHAEIDALYQAWVEARQRAEAETDSATPATKLAAAEPEAPAQAQQPTRWSGRGEIGAFRATGGSNDIGASGAINATWQGDRWSHKLSGRADYQAANGRTTREQMLLAYEPRYTFSDRLFAYGLAQYERDRVQGFAARYALSGGVGYRVIDADDMDLSLKAGPAVRVNRLINGGGETRLAGLLGVDFDWRITDRLTFTQDTNAVAETGGSALLIVDSNNTSLNLVTGLEAKISDALSTRMTYQVDYNSNPPAGRVNTSTLSRFTLVYGF